MSLDFRDIQDILRLLDDSPYDALDLQTGRFHLTLRRQGGSWTQETRSIEPEAGSGTGTQPAGAMGGEASTPHGGATAGKASALPVAAMVHDASGQPTGARAHKASTEPVGAMDRDGSTQSTSTKARDSSTQPVSTQGSNAIAQPSATQGGLHAAPRAGSPQAPVPAATPSGNAGPGPSTARAAGAPVPGLVAAANSAVAPAGTAAAAITSAAAVTGLLEVRAPMPGTFYRAPQPGAAPFVSVGQRVEETTAIGIIEVMKLMSTIPAGQCGTVAEILAEDASFVEKGQVLLRVRPEPA